MRNVSSVDAKKWIINSLLKRQPFDLDLAKARENFCQYPLGSVLFLCVPNWWSNTSQVEAIILFLVVILMYGSFLCLRHIFSTVRGSAFDCNFSHVLVSNGVNLCTYFDGRISTLHVIFDNWCCADSPTYVWSRGEMVRGVSRKGEIS